MSGRKKRIAIMVDAQLKKEIIENRKKLEPIVDAVTLCGRLGLPLREHRDDVNYHPEVGGFLQGALAILFTF